MNRFKSFKLSQPMTVKYLHAIACENFDLITVCIDWIIIGFCDCLSLVVAVVVDIVSHDSKHNDI